MAGIPILTYHSLNIAGNDYLGNDHVALREDLHLLTALGWRIVPLAWLADHRMLRAELCLTADMLEDALRFA